MAEIDDPNRVQIDIHCKHCRKKQFVRVRKSRAAGVNRASVKCVYCGEEFLPDIILGEILEGPLRPQNEKA